MLDQATAPVIHDFDLESLLATAAARLRRQRQFERPLAAGAAAGRALEAGLDRARDCVAALARPRAALLVLSPVLAQISALGAGRVVLALISLSYGQEQAFARLAQDYMDHHLQTLLARETLFALGRAVRDRVQEQYLGKQVRRLTLLAAEPSAASAWDVEKVQNLLALYGEAPLGVTLTEGGCFRPLHALLTVFAVEQPA